MTDEQTAVQELGALVPGEPIAVTIGDADGIRCIEHGRFERLGRDAFRDRALFWRSAGESHDVPRSALLAVHRVDPRQLAATYRLGERVMVCRHGREHTGRVVKIARTQLTVRTLLWAGTSRERHRDVRVCALDVRAPWDARR